MARTEAEEQDFSRAMRASREFQMTWPNKLNEIAGTPIAVWMRIAQAQYPEKSLEQHALDLVKVCLYEDSVASFTELLGKMVDPEKGGSPTKAKEDK